MIKVVWFSIVYAVLIWWAWVAINAVFPKLIEKWRTRHKREESEELMAETDNPPKEFIERKEELNDAWLKAKEKRERRAKRRLSNTSHQSDDDRKTKGAFGG